jgi:hypothetical protein
MVMSASIKSWASCNTMLMGIVVRAGWVQLFDPDGNEIFMTAGRSAARAWRGRTS